MILELKIVFTSDAVVELLEFKRLKLHICILAASTTHSYVYKRTFTIKITYDPLHSM